MVKRFQKRQREINSSMIVVTSQRFYVKQETQICSKLIKKGFGLSIQLEFCVILVFEF